jgi:hypothetical protein
VFGIFGRVWLDNEVNPCLIICFMVVAHPKSKRNTTFVSYWIEWLDKEWIHVNTILKVFKSMTWQCTEISWSTVQLILFIQSMQSYKQCLSICFLYAHSRLFYMVVIPSQEWLENEWIHVNTILKVWKSMTWQCTRIIWSRAVQLIVFIQSMQSY